MVKFCHKCGTQAIDDESVFCNKCGTKYIQSPPEKKDDVCPNCGIKILDKGSLFCNKCGSQFSASTTVRTQPVVTQSSKNKYSTNSGRTYEPNYLLIIVPIVLFLSIFIPTIGISLCYLIILFISPVIVYFDAKSLGLGSRKTNETFSSKTWSPFSWALTVCLLWIIGYPLYLYKRRELFFYNLGEQESEVNIRSYPQRTQNIGTPYSPQSVTVEFILGLIGGIIGFLAGIAAIVFGSLASAFAVQGASNVIGLGVGAIIFSIIGIIGAAVVKSKTKIAGYLMIISAIGGLICISAFYILSFILLIAGGILAVIHGRDVDSSDYGGDYSVRKKSSGSLLGLAIIGVGIVIFSLIIAAFVFGMAGNVPSSSPTVQPSSITLSPTIDVKNIGKTTSRPTVIATTTQPSGPAATELILGQSASNSERQVTVFSAQKTPTYSWTGSSGTKYPTNAKSGNTFIMVDAELKNIGSDRMYASSGDFSMSDSDGNRYDPGMYSGDDSLGYLKELYKNQKVRGKVLFEVPQSAKNLILYYDFGNVFSGTKLASWTIN